MGLLMDSVNEAPPVRLTLYGASFAVYADYISLYPTTVVHVATVYVVGLLTIYRQDITQVVYMSGHYTYLIN